MRITRFSNSGVGGGLPNPLEAEPLPPMQTPLEADLPEQNDSCE